ncbi:DNA excision repair protein ERCC-1 [Patagioenas fasciata]|uniref:DNA excision repair protein ERCC-1 n=1 Tax=Patagioenas fasciata TaxID=372321 RepID=UPI003A9A3CCE
MRVTNRRAAGAWLQPRNPAHQYKSGRRVCYACARVARAGGGGAACVIDKTAANRCAEGAGFPGGGQSPRGGGVAAAVMAGAERDPAGPGEPAPLPALKPGGKSSAIVVSPRQRGNPVLRFIRNVPWEFGDIGPDYVLGQSSCALFLSLRYHHLHPQYVHERLRQLGRSYALQLLLLQVDVGDPQQALKELGKVCILTDCTLLLAWSPEEAARYLETFKAYEQKPPDLLMERLQPHFLPRLSDCLSSLRSVTKPDALSLLTAFGSLANVVRASRQELSLCPGIGPQKAKRLFDVLHEPFLTAPERSQGPPK